MYVDIDFSMIKYLSCPVLQLCSYDFTLNDFLGGNQYYATNAIS